MSPASAPKPGHTGHESWQLGQVRLNWQGGHTGQVQDGQVAELDHRSSAVLTDLAISLPTASTAVPALLSTRTIQGRARARPQLRLEQPRLQITIAAVSPQETRSENNTLDCSDQIQS